MLSKYLKSSCLILTKEHFLNMPYTFCKVYKFTSKNSKSKAFQYFDPFKIFFKSKNRIPFYSKRSEYYFFFSPNRFSMKIFPTFFPPVFINRRKFILIKLLSLLKLHLMNLLLDLPEVKKSIK